MSDGDQTEEGPKGEEKRVIIRRLVVRDPEIIDSAAALEISVMELPTTLYFT